MSNRITAIARTTAAHAKPVALPVLFSVLMWASAAAGAVPIPGTPVPITLQTMVVMLAGLMLTPSQAAMSVAMYLGAGAAGLPVFTGGMSTAALISPTGGFLLGFLPGVVVIALLKGRRRAGSALWTVPRYALASVAGGILTVYAFGIVMQSVLTGVPIAAIAVASAGFIVGDLVKAAVASLTAAALNRR